MAIKFLDEPKSSIRFLDQEPERAKPLSFLERGKFAFGDEPGRRSFLEQRFPGKEITQKDGRFQISGTPVDPEGFDLGDIADVSDEIVRLGGQIGGAAIGLPGGFPGLLAGGGLGRGAAQGSVEAIGRALGVREADVPEIAKEILKESALGVAGEAGGFFIAKALAPGVKFLANFFNKGKQKFLDPPIRAFFRFTGDIENFALKRVQSKGANKIITKENLADDALLRVANKIQINVKKLRIDAGKVVGEQKKLLSKSNKTISTSQAKGNFDDSLVDANILDAKFKELPKLVAAKEAPRNELLKVRDALVAEDKMSTGNAIRLKDELQDLVTFSPEGKIKVSSNEQRIVKNLIRDLDTQLNSVSTEFKVANEKFAEIAGLQKVLETKLNLPAGEGFVRDVLKEKFAEFPKQKLIQLNNLLPKNKQFFEELSDVAAAQQFKSSTFRGIRSGIFSGIAGSAGFGLGGPAGAVKGLAIGAGISTPRLVAEMLRGQQAVGKGIVGGFGTLGKTAAREAVPALEQTFPQTFGQFRGQ